MLFSLQWLEELLDTALDAEGSAGRLTDRGLTVDAIHVGTAQTGAVLDIDVPANRPDCLGHLGIARELAAAMSIQLTEPLRSKTAANGPIEIVIEAPEACPRYTAGFVHGVTVGPSPDWVRRRLDACGLRSINNVVDVSNLVLLELGQPVHFFDRSRLSGDRIVVRYATDGESFVTLDDQTRALDRKMALIADGNRPVALAGVMGGANTEISDSTTDVLVEAAAFDPHTIRRTARRLGMHTDASHRFERGVDPDSPLRAQALAARLLESLAGGTPDESVLDVCPNPSPEKSLSLRLSELERLLGYRPEDAEAVAALSALCLQPGPIEAGTVTIQVPTWRVDLECEEDLVEEVARHLGYDRIPVSARGLESIGFVDSDPTDSFAAARALEEGARDALAPLGFHEAYGYAMIEAGEDRGFVPDAAESSALHLTNPLSEALAVLRTSLLPGLLRAADLNLRRGVRDVRLFEVGRVFESRGLHDLPDEPVRAGLVWSGLAEPQHHGRAADSVGIQHLSGVVESTMTRIRPGLTIYPRQGTRTAFHPGYSVEWTAIDGTVLGWGGSLHPERQDALPQAVWLAEIDLTAVGRCSVEPIRYEKLPRVGAVHRDLALVVAEGTPYSTILGCLSELQSPAPCRFEAIDRYEGAPLKPGQSSLTVRIVLQPFEAALTDEQIEAFRTLAVNTLEDRLGVQIRG